MSVATSSMTENHVWIVGSLAVLVLIALGLMAWDLKANVEPRRAMERRRAKHSMDKLA